MILSSRTLLSHSFIVCLLVTNFACTQKDNTSSEQPVIRFSYQNRIGSALPILAVEMGLFEKHGIQVKPSRFNSGPACAESLYTGAADIATMGDTTTIIALARHTPARILTSHANGEHRHRLVVNVNAPYQSLSDLKGLCIAMKKGTSTYGGFLKYIQTQGLLPDDFSIVELSPDAMPDALASGFIQAFAASEPTPSIAEMRGARQLATFGGLGNQYPILMLVTNRFSEAHSSCLPAFLDALRDAEVYLESHPQEASNLIATSLGLPTEVTAKAMTKHEFTLQWSPTILTSLQSTAQFLLEHAIIDNLPKFSSASVKNNL